MKQFIQILTGTLQSYGRSAKGATSALIRNWQLIPASVAAFVFFTFMIAILSQAGLGLAGGFIAGLIQIALLTLYYHWIRQTAGRERLTRQELIFFDYSLFSAIINVGFIFFIAQLLLQSFLQANTAVWVMPVFNLAVCVVFNPVAEIIEEHRGDGLWSLREAYEFVMENWIEWFIPFVLMLLPWIWISPAGPLAALSATDPLLPAMPLIREAQIVASYFLASSSLLPGILLGVILANWFMIFRALLYRELSTSSRRKRAYLLRNS